MAAVKLVYNAAAGVGGFFLLESVWVAFRIRSNYPQVYLGRASLFWKYIYARWVWVRYFPFILTGLELKWLVNYSIKSI